jgi:uncharacterized repeat protein (TIGR01451 family)
MLTAQATSIGVTSAVKTRKRRVAPLAALALFLCAGSGAVGQVGNLKISQIYGGGGGATGTFRQDYVELFNAGATPILLDGLSIQYASATGTTWSRHVLAGSVAPGGYYLIRMANSASGLADVPISFDLEPGTSIAMSATVGKVALVNGTTALSGACPTGATIIDFVGYGTTANCFEGAGRAAAPSVTNATFRNSGGCTDTNDNAADFAADVAVPRNQSTPANPCPLPPGADLSVTLTDGVAQASVGQTITYTAQVVNGGPDALTGGTATVAVPAGTTFQSSSPPSVPSGNDRVFTLPLLGVGESAFLNVTVTVESSATVLAGSATVAAASPPDPAGGNNTATDSTLVFSDARAPLITGVQAGAQGINLVDLASGAHSPVVAVADVRGMAADDADRVFYYSGGGQLFRLPYGNLSSPEVVANFSGAVSTISGGLAFDPIRRNLIGSTTDSLYRIDTSTGRTTLLRDFGSGDFGGLDYDATLDRVVAVNDSTALTNGLNGRGVYALDAYGVEAPQQLVAGYPIKTAPSTADTDIDGLAIGGGRYYLVADESSWLYTFDVGTAGFLANTPQPYGTDRTGSGAAYSAERINQSPGVNLALKTTATQDCLVQGAGNLVFTSTLTNLGPSAASNAQVVVQLPAGTTFVSSNPPLTPVGDTLTAPAGSLLVGQAFQLEVTVAAAAPGDYSSNASASAMETDPFPGNNQTARTVRVAAPPPATAAVTGILSSFPGSNTIPGLPGVLLSNVTDSDRPFASANGQNWLIGFDTDGPTTSDRVILKGSGTTFSVAVQEGVTDIGGGLLAGATIFNATTINDAGDFTIGTDTDASSTAAGQTIVKSIGGVFSVVARQGNAVPSVQDALYGATLGNPTIQADGTVSFYSSLTGVPTANDLAVFSQDGNTAVAREGIDAPTGSLGGETYLTFDTGATDGLGYWRNAAGNRYCLRGTISAGTANDVVLVVDGAVVAQEGVVLPGTNFVSPVSSVLMNFMNPGGDWFAYGSNADGQDWALRNGQVVAQTDAPITPGSGELWDDASFTQTFFMNVGNNVGDYVVGGLTTAANQNANAVLVLNGTTVVVREDDPIDLNGNGVFDDDAYVHIYRDDFAFLTDDGFLYFNVRVRNGSSRCLGTTPTESGQAFVRVRVFEPNTCPQDYNGTDGVNGDDLADYIADFFDTTGIQPGFAFPIALPGGFAGNATLAYPGFGTPCPEAGDVPQPNPWGAPIDAYRTGGFKVGVNQNNLTGCNDGTPGASTPNGDDLADYIALFFNAPPCP